jgi:hypothetical protein
MSITPIGWILLPTGAVLLLWFPKHLYNWFLFFIPFSATAVLNIGSSDASSGLQASMYFGILWLSYELTQAGGTLKTQIPRSIAKPSSQILIFGAAALFSLCMPVLINGGLEVTSADLSSAEAVPLRFGSQHLTQTAYLLYGIFIAIFVAKRLCNPDEMRNSLKVILASTLFVSVWGFLQWLLYLLDLPYPSFLFNSSETKSALGFGSSFGDFGFKRISSVAVEPSLFAQYLLVFLPFVLFAVLSRRNSLSKLWDLMTLLSAVAVLLISTSASAYLGLGLLAVLIILSPLRTRLLKAHHLIILLSLLVAFAYFYLSVSSVREFINSEVFGKSDTYSGLERVRTIILAADYFIQYPILGIGWGSATSHDLIIKLLSNTGIVGCIAFFIFLTTLLLRLFRGMYSTQEFESLAFICCSFVSVASLIVLNTLTGFAFAFGHFWFVLGVGMAAPYLAHSGMLRSRRVESGSLG